MTLLAVPLTVNDMSGVTAALADASRAKQAGARLIEWRIDALAMASDAPNSLGHLVRESPLPSIVTCRPTWEGGAYEGAEHRRPAMLHDLITSDQPPRYIDVELVAITRDRTVWQPVLDTIEQMARERDRHAGLIVSSHDFEGRPTDLLQRVEAMTMEPACSVIKIAWLARSLRDNLEAFDIIKARHKPTIALCMGPFGMMSRALAGKFGGMLTFASLEAGAESAPGQPTIDELRSVYRFDSINADTSVYGVIGWPVGHSRGPQIHNAGFERIDYNGMYLPLPIPPEWEHFKATVGALVDHEGLDFRGASVTIPHKEHLVRFVRERGGTIEALTQRIGAANTLIVHDNGSLECVNTDCPAAVDALCNGMGIQRCDLRERRVAIIGAGGVARAIAVGMTDAGANVIIFNRMQDKARALANELSQLDLAGKIVPGKQGRIDCGCFDIIINCTPIGMEGGPAPDESPLPADTPLDETCVVFDTVYTPIDTPLIQQARTAGARAITGDAMFKLQASNQFKRWAGPTIPGKADVSDQYS